MLKRRRFFSLIEILIALVILVSLLGIVSLNVKGAMRGQAYDSQVDRLVSQLKLAQDVLVIFNIETELQFSADEARLIPVGTLNRAHEILISRAHTSLSALASVEFESSLGEERRRPFALKFLDAGFEMPKGVLKLVSQDGDITYIYLPGYPARLTRSNKPPDVQKIDQEDRQFYEKLTASTWSTLPDDSKKTP